MDDNLHHHNIVSRNAEKRDYGQLQIFILNKNFTNGPKFTIGKYRQGYIRNNEGNSFLFMVFHGFSSRAFIHKKISSQLEILVLKKIHEDYKSKHPRSDK